MAAREFVVVAGDTLPAQKEDGGLVNTMGELVDTLFDAPQSQLIVADLDDRVVSDAMDDLLMTLEQDGTTLHTPHVPRRPAQGDPTGGRGTRCSGGRGRTRRA